jgi:hypothetical protein
MKACSQVCGVVFDPLDEDYVEVCEDCEVNGEAAKQIGEKIEEQSYYLGACGLIMDYLL